jgi:replicative DNA helicase
VPNYQPASEAFDAWRESVLTGEQPILYSVGGGELASFEIGPKRVLLIGGAPGEGKTAFTMQVTVDGLRLNPELRAVVCNVEMSPTVLLDRQLARLSGIDAATIRYRRFDASHADRLDRGLNTLEAIVDRLCFVRPPFDLDNVAATADEFQAAWLVLDYIQRIPAPGQHGDRRASVDATMNFLREFADAGMAVVVVAAVARQKDSRGRSTYSGDSLSLASFRESSELEFGADDAYMLVRDEGRAGGVTLRHLKARYSERRDIRLQFNRAYQSFTTELAGLSTGMNGELSASLAQLWHRTEAAAEDDEEGGDA